MEVTYQIVGDIEADIKRKQNCNQFSDSACVDWKGQEGEDGEVVRSTWWHT